MGRGRAKAKQTKVARELKYHSPNTDLAALQRELGGQLVSLTTTSTTSYDEFVDDDDEDDADDDAGRLDAADGADAARSALSTRLPPRAHALSRQRASPSYDPGA